MNIKSAVITALRALRRNKVRSSLTSVGIIIGVASVIIMIGLGNSAKVAVQDKISSYGAFAMSVHSRVKLISSSDVKFLKKNFYQVKYISPISKAGNVMVKHQNMNMESLLLGVNNDFIKLQNRKIAKGRFFTKSEILSKAKVAIIGPTVKKEVLGNMNPIGQQILVKGIPVKIIGLMGKTGRSFSGKDFDNIILIPYTTANTKFHRRNGFDEMYVSTNKDLMVPETVDIVTRYFYKKNNVEQGQALAGFSITTSKDKLKKATDISNALALLLAGIASISLVVGGVGIMNIMLVSVTERTREIGIRMAIGAKKKDILSQFLIESVTLSSAGGVIGITIGLIVYIIIINVIEWPFIFSLFSILVAVLFASGVGIFFGFYPAKKAASLKPIDALKFE